MIKIFSDGANIKEITELNKDEMIDGFTTNPTLMKASGITDYRAFAKELLSIVDIEKPVSFEVLEDSYWGIIEQAREISHWGKNVYVKIPVTTTGGVGNYEMMRALSNSEVKINATAITTFEQIDRCVDALGTRTPSIISIFAGRIADTGRNPELFIEYASYKKVNKQEILWASTREVYNYKQAITAGADIITITPAIYSKMKQQWRKPLNILSLETVRMFYDDAKKSGLTL